MKKFETEYKDQIAIELPDLWDRIEAGVDEYEATKNSTVTALADDNIENKITAISRKRTFVTIAKVLGAAACLFIVINVFRIAGTNKSEATADSTMFNIAPAAESVMEDSCAAEEAEEAAADYSYAEEDAYSEAAFEETYEPATEEAATEASEITVNGSLVTTKDSAVIDSALINGEVVYASGTWNQKGDISAEYDDLTVIANLFNCDKDNAAELQSLFREGNMAGVEYGFYISVSPEVENYMDGDSAFDGLDRDNIALTLIETEDGSEYYVFTLVEDKVTIVEVAKVN